MKNPGITAMEHGTNTASAGASVAGKTIQVWLEIQEI